MGGEWGGSGGKFVSPFEHVKPMRSGNETTLESEGFDEGLAARVPVTTLTTLLLYQN